MILTKWDRRFMELARLVATWSKDPRRKVGAVIVDYDRCVVSTGYNGFPRHVRDSEERLHDKETKLRLTVHAEANAILRARGGPVALDSTAMYCTSFPCSECAKLIVQARVGSIVCPPPKTEGRWATDAEFSRVILAEGGRDLTTSEDLSE